MPTQSFQNTHGLLRCYNIAAIRYSAISVMLGTFQKSYLTFSKFWQNFGIFQFIIRRNVCKIQLKQFDKIYQNYHNEISRNSKKSPEQDFDPTLADAMPKICANLTCLQKVCSEFRVNSEVLKDCTRVAKKYSSRGKNIHYNASLPKTSSFWRMAHFHYPSVFNTQSQSPKMQVRAC